MTKRVNEGTTHWDGCEVEHHECALARLAKAEADAAAMRLALEACAGQILVGCGEPDCDDLGCIAERKRLTALSGTAGEHVAAVYRAAKDVGKWDKGDGALQRLVAAVDKAEGRTE